MRWRILSSNSVILIISIITYIITQTKGLSYRCENDQILIVQSFGNDTIRMHCQKLQLCGYSNLKCTYDREQTACGGKTNFVAHVNQLTPTGKVVHTCCDMTFKDNKNKPMIEHDGNDCFVYELPDGTSDTTPGSEASDIIKKNIEVVRNGFTVLKDASQIPEDFGGYTGYRLRLFMLRNKSPPLLIVKAIERTSGGYRVTICRPRCGKFNREGLISHGDSVSTFDKDISIPKDKLITSYEDKTKLKGESGENENASNGSKQDTSVEENENKSSSKSSSETFVSSSKVSSESEKENAGSHGSLSKESSSSGPKSGHIESVGKNGEWTAASWTSWTSNTWTTWSTQTWNTWNENEKLKQNSLNTRVRGQIRGDRVSSSDLSKKIIEEVTKDLKHKGTDINDYDNLNSHETHEMESREKGFIDNRKVVIINHNSTTYNNYIHHGEKDNYKGEQNPPSQIVNNNSFGNVGSSSNNAANNKMPNGISQINNNVNGKKTEDNERNGTNDSDENNGDSFYPIHGKNDKNPSKKNGKSGEVDNGNDNDKSENDNNENDNNGDLANKIRSSTKKPSKNRSGKKGDQSNSKELSGEKNNEGNEGNDNDKIKKNNNGKKGNNGDKKNKNNNKSNEERKDKSNEKMTDDGDDNNQTIDQNNKSNEKSDVSKNKNVDNNKNTKNKKTTPSSRHPENEGDEGVIEDDGNNGSGKQKPTKTPESENLITTKIVEDDGGQSTKNVKKNSGEKNSSEKDDKNKLNSKPNKNKLTDNSKTGDDDDDKDNNKKDNSKSNEKDGNKEKDNLNNSKESLTNSGDKTKNNSGDQISTSDNNTPSGSSTITSGNKNENENKSHIPEGDGDNNNENKSDGGEEIKEIEEESGEEDDNNRPTTTTIIDTDNGNENINNEKDILGGKNDTNAGNKQPTNALSGSGSLINKEDNFGTQTTITNEKTNSSREENGETTGMLPDLTENGNTPFNLGNSGELGTKLRGTPNDNSHSSGGDGSLGGGSSGSSSSGNGPSGQGSSGNPDSNNGVGRSGGKSGNNNSGGGISGEGDSEENEPANSKSKILRSRPRVAGSPTQKASGSQSPQGNVKTSDPPSAFNALAKRNCFAGDTIIETPAGSKRMDKLQIGDLVLVPSPEGIQKFEKIEMFYHRKPDYEQKFLQIQTESGRKLSLTELHLIPFGKCGDAINAIQNGDNLQQWMLSSKYAYKVKEGECVISYDDNNHLIADKIIKVGRKISKGIYSPITTEGTIVTDGIFTSCFSQIESQATQKLAYDIITMFYRAFGYLSDNTQQLIQEIPSSVDMLHQLNMAVDGFWLFDGLADEPYGLLPLHNLNTKNGPTSTKQYDRIGSYQWYLEDETPTILIPGMPHQSHFWPGGKLTQDAGVVIYDVNHLKCPTGSMDPAILAAKHIGDKKKKPINFDDYDFITDAVNLQKLFAFAQEAGDGLFRIDCERVGKTVILSRVEASDLMEIGHVTFDQHLKGKMNKPRSKFTTGPFYQLVHYQFGEFKILVRYEVDSGDYVAGKELENKFENDDVLPPKKKFDDNNNIEYVDYGVTSKLVPLQLLTTYPEGAGFPFFTWAQLFFTGVDQTFVGWFKGNGDFKKPAVYSLPDISKLMKPLPYVVLSKVHDCLKKIHMFLTKNDPEFRCGLIWKGKPHLEIFEKFPEANGGVSSGVRKFLETQCKDMCEEENDEEK